MGDTERVIGELTEFKRATLSKLNDLEIQVRELSYFKWKATGFMAAILTAIELAHLAMKANG